MCYNSRYHNIHIDSVLLPWSYVPPGDRIETLLVPTPVEEIILLLSEDAVKVGVGFEASVKVTTEVNVQCMVIDL